MTVRDLAEKFLQQLPANMKKVVAVLFIAALLTRTLYVVYSYSTAGKKNWSDDWYYLSMGEQIAAGDWNPRSEGRNQMMVAPVIPLIIAFFTILFSDPVIPVLILNILLTSLTVIVLFHLGRELFDDTTGLLAALWGLLFTDHFKYLPHVLKEPLLYFLVPLVIFLLVRAVRSNSAWSLISLSVTFSVLIHTDERFLVYFPFLLIAFLFIKPLSLRVYFRKTTVFAFMVLLLMVPWSVRNYKVTGQVVIISPRTTVFTSKLWGKNLEPASSHFDNDEVVEKLNSARKGNALKFGEEYGIKPVAQGKGEARLKAFINFWQPAYFRATFIQYGFRPQKWSFAHNMASLLFYGIFLPFYFGAILLALKRKYYFLFFLSVVPVIHSLIHAYMVWPLERYRSPVNFIVAIFAIWFISQMVKKAVDKSGSVNQDLLLQENK